MSRIAVVPPLDDPWSRLPWLGLVSLIVVSFGFYGFLRLTLTAPEVVQKQPHVVTVGVITLPAANPSPTLPTPSTPIPPPPPEPEPVPSEAIPPATPLPPAPTTVPIKKARPAARPSPAPEQTAPTQIETPPQASAPPVAPPSTTAGPSGGNMSAHAIYQPMPKIPDELRRRNIELVAIARFHVFSDGKAVVDLIQATPEPSLNRALLEALKSWRFFPALENGQPIESTIDIRIPIEVR